MRILVVKDITSVTLKIIIFLVGLLGVLSCKREYIENGFEGPAQISASDKFSIINNLTINTKPYFAVNVIPNFLATFNETISWTIVITGDSSTGIKTFSGTSNSINVSWDGTHDGTYYFEDGEPATATLSILGSPIIDTIHFIIGSALQVRNTTPNYILVGNTDLEYASKYTNKKFPIPIGSTIFGFSTFEINTNPSEAFIVQQNDVIRAPEGKYFGRVSGSFLNLSAQPNGVFIDGVQIRNEWDGSGPNNSYLLPTTWKDPTQIYLNIWVRGIDNLPPGFQPHATLNFEVDEDDNGLFAIGPPPTTINANPKNLPVNCNQTSGDKWCPCNEDGWFLKIPITHQGWKLFSCRYADLLQNEDWWNGGNGNRILEPQKVCRIQIGANCNVPWSNIQADFDYATITYGGPLKPSTIVNP